VSNPGPNDNGYSVSNERVEQARKLTGHGFVIIPLNDKIAIIKYSNRRKLQATTKEIELWFSNGSGKTPRANGIAIAINNTEFGIDTDGQNCESIFLNIISELSADLQNKIHATMFTKTPRGFHRTFRYLAEDFPDGIKDRVYFKQNSEHGEIALKGKNHYLVERGPGYEIINDVENVVTLSKDEVNEFLGSLAEFNTKEEALTKIVGKLRPYYVVPNRNDIIFSLSGYLHKGKTPESVIIDIAKRLIDATGYSDENPVKIFQTIRNTCAKDPDSDQVSGYKRLHEILTEAQPSGDTKPGDVSNLILEIEYSLKGLGLFTIPRREHQQVRHEIIDQDFDIIGGDEGDGYDELAGIHDNILAQLDSCIYAVISSNPPVLYIADRNRRCIRKAIVKFESEETRQSKNVDGQRQNSVTHTERQLLLLKQKLIYAIPRKIAINANPLTDERTYTITFVSRRDNGIDNNQFTMGPGTISEIIEALDKKGKVLKKPEATDALTAIAERYDELGLAEVSNGIIEPGYYWIDGEIRYYGINQNLNLDLNNGQYRQAALDCINALEELQLRSKKSAAFPTVLKWGILAPFSFITKTQTSGVEDWLPWLYLYDSTDTGKTTLIINAVLAIWGKYDKQENEIHFRGPGSIDTPSKLGITVSQTTYPILVDEIGGLLNDDSRRDNILLDMVKYSVQGKYVRSKFHENILALSPIAFTSNDSPPQDPAYRRRFVAIQFFENEKWAESEKEDFKRWLVDQNIRAKLGVLGDFVSRYVFEHPEVLRYSSYSWNEYAIKIIEEFFNAAGIQAPDWINLIAPQTIVEEASEERQFEIRGFLQQAILDGYRRDSVTNPDPSTIDTNGKRIYLEMSFQQKINYCLENKSVPFLHLCKRNAGQEFEIAITSNVRSELKRHDRLASAPTMNALASKIPGFKYEPRSIGAQTVRVVCGSRMDFFSFLDCSLTEQASEQVANSNNNWFTGGGKIV
jgi:hypothetical protein